MVRAQRSWEEVAWRSRSRLELRLDADQVSRSVETRDWEMPTRSNCADEVIRRCQSHMPRSSKLGRAVAVKANSIDVLRSEVKIRLQGEERCREVEDEVEIIVLQEDQRDQDQRADEDE